MTRTKLAFDAKIAGVTVKPPKDAGGKGHFDLTLTIEQPDPPTPPPVPWKFTADNDRTAWKSRPEDVAEEAEEHEERLREQERYDTERAGYEQQEADFRGLLALYRAKVMAYAQVVGIASVFGSQTVTVVLMPSNQDLIPGFAAELTSEASHALLLAEADDQAPEAPTEAAGRSSRGTRTR